MTDIRDLVTCTEEIREKYSSILSRREQDILTEIISVVKQDNNITEEEHIHLAMCSCSEENSDNVEYPFHCSLYDFDFRDISDYCGTCNVMQKV